MILLWSDFTTVIFLFFALAIYPVVPCDFNEAAGFAWGPRRSARCRLASEVGF